jgi:hypothetical protein
VDGESFLKCGRIDGRGVRGRRQQIHVLRGQGGVECGCVGAFGRIVEHRGVAGMRGLSRADIGR